MIARMVRKHRVLKLVHPGGFAEIHKNPITADEVMRKNPRHCVTRPDVFKFPWIVVRPESVLNIGSVFYIVPFHTIHRLLRKKRCPFEDSQLIGKQLLDSSPIKLMYFHELVKEQCPKISPPRSKIDFKIDDLLRSEMFPEFLIQDVRESPLKSQFELELDEFDGCLKEAYSDDHWSSDFTNDDHHETTLEAARDSFTLHRPFLSPGIVLNDPDKDRTYRRDDSALQSNNCQNNKVLKSCLKKENSCKSRGFKVRFDIPCENNEKMIRKTLSLQQKFP